MEVPFRMYRLPLFLVFFTLFCSTISQAETQYVMFYEQHREKVPKGHLAYRSTGAPAYHTTFYRFSNIFEANEDYNPDKYTAIRFFFSGPLVMRYKLTAKSLASTPAFPALGPQMLIQRCQNLLFGHSLFEFPRYNKLRAPAEARTILQELP